jgi:hypothetical protein
MPFKFSTPVAIVATGVAIALAILFTNRYDYIPLDIGPFHYAIQHDRWTGSYCFVGSNGANPTPYRRCR